MSGLWPWTAVILHAIRQALCPSPGIMDLMHSLANGELDRDLAEGERKRIPQSITLRDLLSEWVLG
jgi:hypothetical protein